jgi:hypothetical protein
MQGNRIRKVCAVLIIVAALAGGTYELIMWWYGSPKLSPEAVQRLPAPEARELMAGNVRDVIYGEQSSVPLYNDPRLQALYPQSSGQPVPTSDSWMFTVQTTDSPSNAFRKYNNLLQDRGMTVSVQQNGPDAYRFTAINQTEQLNLFIYADLQQGGSVVSINHEPI